MKCQDQFCPLLLFRNYLPLPPLLEWSYYNELAHSKWQSRLWLGLQEKQGRNKGSSTLFLQLLGMKNSCEKPQEHWPALHIPKRSSASHEFNGSPVHFWLIRGGHTQRAGGHCGKLPKSILIFWRLYSTSLLRQVLKQCCATLNTAEGQELLQAQFVNTHFLVSKEKQPAWPLKCCGGRSPEDAYLQRQGDLPIGSQCLHIPQLYHRIVPALWVWCNSSASESGGGYGKDDSLRSQAWLLISPSLTTLIG